MSAAPPHPSRSETGPRRVIILGSTGSIGTQSIEVVRHVNGLYERGACPVRLDVVGLAAGGRGESLRDQARALGVRDVALATGACPDGPELRARTGPDAAERLIAEVECDLVLAAMVGVAGLPATLAAIERGRDVALANKETLVAAGALVVPAAERSGSRLLPVDSEHSGVWQCLRAGDAADQPGNPAPPFRCAPHVARVTLTASGGAFRGWAREEVERATPELTLRHPIWSMGPKVTVDSASLMNKGLELIEAHWLFGLDPARLGVLIHPQSIVHALVEHADGSVIAQLGSPDMRTPIMHAMCWPWRPPAAAPRLSWTEARSLDFEPPDPERFPALGLALEAMRRGGTAGAALNGANEEAVLAFLGAGTIPFGRLIPVVAAALERVETTPLRTLDDAMRADGEARRAVRALLG